MTARIAICCLYAFAAPGSAVPFPAEYRTWTHVKTMFIGPASKLYEQRGGFHHYFANSQAVEGYRTGKFPDGSIIVDEGVRARDEGGVMLEGALRSVEVMHKDSRMYRDTGGWGFDRFEADNRTEGAAASVKTACYTCHAKNQDRDFVYSEMRK